VSPHRIAALAAVAGLLVAPGAARADGPDECSGFGPLKDRPVLALARVRGAKPRSYFVKGASAAEGCPAAAEACRDRSYLVPGDAVIAGTVRGAFTCVDYPGAEGADRAGWMASADLRPEPAPPVSAPDWPGRWRRDEADITIRPADGKRLLIHGDATFGAHDPDRVKRGGVNVGEIAGRAAPDGAGLAFDMRSDTVSLPVEQGGADECKVWMRRLGPYLLVSDNRNCGGMNVSFDGIYRRAP
jgi:hypothetical protein